MRFNFLVNVQKLVRGLITCQLSTNNLAAVVFHNTLSALNFYSVLQAKNVRNYLSHISFKKIKSIQKNGGVLNIGHGTYSSFSLPNITKHVYSNFLKKIFRLGQNSTFKTGKILTKFRR